MTENLEVTKTFTVNEKTQTSKVSYPCSFTQTRHVFFKYPLSDNDNNT